MQKKILDTILCPYTGNSFNVNILELDMEIDDITYGILFTNLEPKMIYPIVNGIPRIYSDAIFQFTDLFKDKFSIAIEKEYRIYENISSMKFRLHRDFIHTQKSFSSEWEHFGLKDSAWGRTIEERRGMTLNWLNISEDDLNGRSFLDVGCGNGEVILSIMDLPSEIYGIDLSFSVDKIRSRIIGIGKKEFLKKVHLLQGNSHNLPLKNDKFDFGHSAGVLHHTPDTYVGFKELTSKVKSSGKCYIEVYSMDHKNAFEKFVKAYIFDLFRNITKFLPHTLLHVFAYILAPVMIIYIQTYGIFSSSKRYSRRNFKEIELSLFDVFSPMYDFHHSTIEVEGWFNALKFKNITKTFWNTNGIGLVGTKGK